MVLLHLSKQIIIIIIIIIILGVTVFNTVRVLAKQDKAKPSTESIIPKLGVRLTAVHVTKVSL